MPARIATAGEEAVFDLKRIVPDGGRSIREGGIEPLGRYRNNLLFAEMEALGRRYGFSIDDPIESLDEEALGAVLYGASEPLRIDARELGGTGNYMVSWEGLADYIEKQREDSSSARGDKWKEQFVVRKVCSVCGGSRLKKEALQFRIDGKNIAELSAMSIEELAVGWRVLRTVSPRSSGRSPGSCSRKFASGCASCST